MKILKTVLNIFKLFGISSYSPLECSKTSHESMLLLWKFVHFLFAITLLGSILYFQKHVFTQSSPLATLTDMFQFIMPSIAHHAILIEGFWEYKTQRCIWLHPQKLANHFSKLGVDVQPFIQNALWSYFVQIITVQGLCLASEFWIIHSIYMRYGPYADWLYHWLYKLTPYSIGRMSLLFHGLFVTLMDTFMQMILAEMHRIGTISKRRTPRIDDAILTSKLLILKDAYEDLAVMNRLVNQQFTISHTFNFFGMFITLAACFFYICTAVIVGSQHPVETCLCPVSAIIVIIHITLTCEGSLKNVKMLPHELNRIEITQERRILRNAVQNFALQIEHQPIQHAAGSLFEINSKLLLEIFAITCTYTVIFVSFM